jgi:hypothetical protein
MSGALIELVSKGVQDVYLIGDPQVSLFRQNYKRHTNFSTKPCRLETIGNKAAGGEIVIPILRKGDMLSAVWADCTVGGGVNATLGNSKFSLYIGGQKVDEQDVIYMNQLYQKFLLNSGGKNSSRYTTWTGAVAGTDIRDSDFLPLTFSCLIDDVSALPLVALQYHEVEIRVSLDSGSPADVKFYAEYVQLDTDERKFFAEKSHEILMTQVQKISADSNGADLAYFNNPVKCLLWAPSVPTGAVITTNSVQLRVNGTPVFETEMPDIYFTSVQPYYHSDCDSELQKGSALNTQGGAFKMYSFAQSANKLQPTGSCNFSRLDNAKITWTSTGTITHIYAVNYNVLRIKDGLGGVAFSN